MAAIKKLAADLVERAKWIIRREFKVLLTDERYLSLTEDQLVFELAHFELDKKERDKEQKHYDETFYDPTYEDWENEVLEDGT